jgi:hypothetical protein
MDSSVLGPEGLAEFWTLIRDLASQLFNDPDKIRKVIETLKIWGLWPASGAPMAALAPLAAADEDRLGTILAEVSAASGVPQAGVPEASGRLLEVLRAAMRWAKEHPEILSALLKFLAL